MNGIKFAAMTSAELAEKNQLATAMISRINRESTCFGGLSIKEVHQFCLDNQNEPAEDSIILADIDDDAQTQVFTVGEYAFTFQLEETDAGDGVPMWNVCDYNGAEAVSIH